MFIHVGFSSQPCYFFGGVNLDDVGKKLKPGMGKTTSFDQKPLEFDVFSYCQRCWILASLSHDVI